MDRFLKILLAILICVFIINPGEETDDASGVCQLAAVHTEVVWSGEIIPPDFHGEDYNAWNCLEIPPSMIRFGDGQTSHAGTRIRSRSFNPWGGQGHCRNVFLKDRRLVIVEKLMAFFHSSGLLPSGYHTFSRYLISLGKIRC